jgi:hypothetical protein
MLHSRSPTGCLIVLQLSAVDRFLLPLHISAWVLAAREQVIAIIVKIVGRA